MEDHNLDIVIFSEMIRKQMQANNPPLIKHRRRQIIRLSSDVFVGSEAVAWAVKTLKAKELNSHNSHTDANFLLNEQQVCSLFQKLMDAGLLQNVTNQEEFKNDKSFFRFSSDDLDAERLIRAVAIGYRLFDDASDNSLFEEVCALGTLVSKEALKASQIVSWLVRNGLCASRDTAVVFAREMVCSGVLKPVDSEVQDFTDSNNFYLFAIDYKRPTMTIERFLVNNRVPAINSPLQQVADGARNKLIHLRQTSENLLDFSQLSLQSSQVHSGAPSRGSATSSDGPQTNNKVALSGPSYQSLLNSDGSVTAAALFHSSSPYVRKDFSIYPDGVGYGFVVRGDGPCFIKIVDPDSPAGKIGLKAEQYIISINGSDVTSMPHTEIADLILFGPKLLKISVMHDKTKIDTSSKPTTASEDSVTTPSASRRGKTSSLPSAQPWIKNRNYVPKPVRQVSSQ